MSAQSIQQPPREKVSRYIADHEWSLLVDHGNLRSDLATRNFRPGANRRGALLQQAAAEQRPSPWQPVLDRDQIVFNMETVRQPGLPTRNIDLRRLIVTTDAGVGKSVALEWLHYRFNLPDTGLLAFRLTAAELEGSLREFQVPQQQLNEALCNWMAGRIRDAAADSPCTPEEAYSLVTGFRRRGRLVLLVDGLDHVSTGLPNLTYILGSAHWQDCRILLAGRPYALQTHFDELKLDAGWEFLRLEEFTNAQQRAYLGRRYNSIPTQARAALTSVFTIPRVLYYMKHYVGEHQFRLIRTAADVYWQAIRHMIKEALNGSEAARQLGLPSLRTVPARVSESQLRQCRHLLAAIAYVMTLGIAGRKKLPSGITAPNFDRVTEDRMERFEEELERRYNTRAEQGLAQDLEALAAMNEFLSRGVFDSDVTGFREIEFRNRSLQEFLTAYYLSTRATAEDSDMWGDRLYLPHDPESDQFYDVWQFVSEMPGTRRPGLDTDGTGPDVPKAIAEEHWLEAIEPLYRPAFEIPRAAGGGQPEDHGNATTARDARRSCEMIFRTWPQLCRLCDEGDERAIAIRSRWQAEFQCILNGDQDAERQASAQEFQNDLLQIPAGTFQMGSPPDKSPRMPDSQEQFWTYWHSRTQEEGSDRENLIEELISLFHLPVGRGGNTQREAWTNWLTQIAAIGDPEDFIRAVGTNLYPSDETPAQKSQTIGDAFLLGRSPVINRWLRLFLPQHGLRDEFPEYSRISPTDNHPAIYVDWYTAWCFCRWTCWDGQHCRLPWENEWEYAAKFGTPWDQRYWWGDAWDDTGQAVTGDGKWRMDTTTVPVSQHANPATREIDTERNVGLMDMLGNVNEWCQDQYRDAYERDDSDEPGETELSRCLRGGSFSSLPERCRSARRSGSNPGNANRHGGFRVSRVAMQ